MNANGKVVKKKFFVATSSAADNVDTGRIGEIKKEKLTKYKSLILAAVTKRRK